MTQRIWTADEEGARVLVRIVMEWPKNWGKPTYIRLFRQSGMKGSTFDRGRRMAVNGRTWLVGGGKGGYRLNADGCWKESLALARGGVVETGGESSAELPSDDQVEEAMAVSLALLKKVGRR
jgi:hypothetical protein